MSLQILLLGGRFKKHVVNISLIRTLHLVVVKLVVTSVGTDGEYARPETLNIDWEVILKYIYWFQHAIELIIQYTSIALLLQWQLLICITSDYPKNESNIRIIKQAAVVHWSVQAISDYIKRLILSVIQLSGSQFVTINVFRLDEDLCQKSKF